MSSKVTRAAYLGMIREDIEELERVMPDNMERDHIEAVLKDSVNFYYPATEGGR